MQVAGCRWQQTDGQCLATARGGPAIAPGRTQRGSRHALFCSHFTRWPAVAVGQSHQQGATSAVRFVTTNQGDPAALVTCCSVPCWMACTPMRTLCQLCSRCCLGFPQQLHDDFAVLWLLPLSLSVCLSVPHSGAQRVRCSRKGPFPQVLTDSTSCTAGAWQGPPHAKAPCRYAYGGSTHYTPCWCTWYTAVANNLSPSTVGPLPAKVFVELQP